MSIKKWNIQGCSRKTHAEFRWVLVYELRISKGCYSILQNSKGWKFVFSGISKGKVTNLKIPVFFFQKTISAIRPIWIFFWNSKCTNCTKFVQSANFKLETLMFFVHQTMYKLYKTYIKLTKTSFVWFLYIHIKQKLSKKIYRNVNQIIQVVADGNVVKPGTVEHGWRITKCRKTKFGMVNPGTVNPEHQLTESFYQTE